MTFDLRIITVGYQEPTLWVTVLVAAVLAIFIGGRLGRRVASQARRSTRWALGVAAAIVQVVAFVILAHLAFSLLFSAVTGGAMVCTYLVGPALFIPAAVSLIAQAATWRATVRRHDHAV